MDNIIIKYRSFWIYLTLMLITAAVFYQVCTYDFVNYDDLGYVYGNPNIQGGITLKAVEWAFTTGHTGYWHPLTWLSLMLDYQLFGNWAGGYHLVSVLFHIVNTVLLFHVLRRMTGAVWPSAFVAAVFALHPLHVESVAWIAERKDVLSTFFGLLTIWAYLRYVEQSGIVRYLLTLLTFALGLMAKPMLVTMPFVLLLLDYWPLARISYKRQAIYHLILEKIPFFIFSAVSSGATFLVQRSYGVVAKLVGLSLKVRIFNAFISYIEYIWKMIWPARLAVFYPYPYRNVSFFYAMVSAAILLAVTILVLRLAKKYRYLATGWLWYLGTLVPVIGIVQVGLQALADRYTYIPLTGLFIIIAWGVPDLLAGWRYKEIALTLSSLVIVSTLAICTHFQVGHWRNSLTLFQHAIEVTHDNYLAYNNLGPELGMQGKLDESIKCFTKALQIKPDFAAAHTNIGYALSLQGKFDEAAGHLAEALQLDPSSMEAHYYFGQVLVQKGKIGEAVTHFEEAMRLKPDWVEPMNNLAWLLAASKETAIHNPDKAIILAQRICELTNYKKPDLLDTLAVAYAAAGDFSKAIETAEKALELCQSSEQSTLKRDIGNRLALYKEGKPYIETK